MYLALYEDNTDMRLSVYLLVCANEVLINECTCLNIHMWCALATYLYDAQLFMKLIQEWVS